MCCKKVLSAFVCAVLFPLISFGQDGEDDDVFELSPFTVDSGSDRGYRASRSKMQAPVAYSDIGATIEGVDGLTDPRLRGATGVVISFGIGFYDDEEKIRRDTMFELLKKARSVIEEHDDLYFEVGSLLVPEGDRRRSKSKQRAVYTSYANFSVHFDFREIVSPLERVLEVRRLIVGMNLETEVTKVFYGAAELVTNNSGNWLAGGVSMIGDRYLRSSEIGSAVIGVSDRLGRSIREQEPQVAVTLVKQADRISIDFVLENYGRSEAERHAGIMQDLETIRMSVLEVEGADFDLNSVLISSGDQVGEQQLRPSLYKARAEFRVFVNLEKDTRAENLVGTIRGRLSALKLESGPDGLGFGEARLVVENPDRYRGELLNAIFADLGEVREGVGEEFSIVPKLENGRVLVRQHSESDVEVWIPYSYDLVSLYERELEMKRLSLEIEKSGRSCCPGVSFHARHAVDGTESMNN